MIMRDGRTPHILEIEGPESMQLFGALASETRLKILTLLAEKDMNIGELTEAIGVSQPTVTRHTQLLEQMGLLDTEYVPGSRGTQKCCRLRYDRFIVSFQRPRTSEYRVEELEMPIGLYTKARVARTCGLASTERIIALLDDPQSFYHPDRATAQILWSAEGFVEYVYPYTLPTSVEIRRLELLFEVCSEAPHYDSHYPSDISVWINGVEIGAWTSPGDLGGKRGRLNPHWWDENWTQYGVLKVWSVDREGSYVDGNKVSDVSLDSTGITKSRSVTVRIGVKPDAEHVGGFNLFGRGFGNYEQDLLLRLHYVGQRHNE